VSIRGGGLTLTAIGELWEPGDSDNVAQNFKRYRADWCKTLGGVKHEALYDLVLRYETLETQERKDDEEAQRAFARLAKLQRDRQKT
jgi:hypothetical protein